jgi:uncharacterized membrane protein YgcG
MDFVKLIFALLFLTISFNSYAAREYPAMSSWRCYSNYASVFVDYNAPTRKACGDLLAEHFTNHPSISSNGIFTYTFIDRINVPFERTDTRNGNVNYYDLGSVYTQIYSCPYGGTLNQTTGICTAEDCPVGQIAKPNGECEDQNKCKSGDVAISSAMYRVNPIDHFFSSPVVCKDGCEAEADGKSPTHIDGFGNVYGTYTFYKNGATCEGSQGVSEYPAVGSSPGGDGGGDSGGGGEPGEGGDEPGGGGEPGGGNTGGGGGLPGNGYEGNDEAGKSASVGCSAFACAGDPINCAIARGVWEHRCVIKTGEDQNVFQMVFNEAQKPSAIQAITEKDVSSYFQEKQYVTDVGICPNDWSVSAFGKTITVPLGWFCQYLGIVKLITQALAWLFVLGLLIKDT